MGLAWRVGAWRVGAWSASSWLAPAASTGTTAWRGGAWRAGAWRQGSWLGDLATLPTIAAYIGVVTLLPDPNALHIGSTNLVQLTGLQDVITGTYPTNATVTASLLLMGLPVPNVAAITLSHVAGTTGANTTYRGAFLPTATKLLLARQRYTLLVKVVDTSGNVREFEQSLPAMEG